MKVKTRGREWKAWWKNRKKKRKLRNGRRGVTQLNFDDYRVMPPWPATWIPVPPPLPAAAWNNELISAWEGENAWHTCGLLQVRRRRENIRFVVVLWVCFYLIYFVFYFYLFFIFYFYLLVFLSRVFVTMLSNPLVCLLLCLSVRVFVIVMCLSLSVFVVCQFCVFVFLSSLILSTKCVFTGRS